MIYFEDLLGRQLCEVVVIDVDVGIDVVDVVIGVYTSHRRPYRSQKTIRVIYLQDQLARPPRDFLLLMST